MKPLCGHKTGNPIAAHWNNKRHRLRWKQMLRACFRAMTRGARQRARAELSREYGLVVR